MTSLNIGRVIQERKDSTNCPQCGAKETARQTAESFGGHTAVYCGQCGYEFPKEKADERR